MNYQFPILPGDQEAPKRPEPRLPKPSEKLPPWLNIGKTLAKALVIGLALLIAFNFLITPINRLLGLPSVKSLSDHAPISSIEVFDRNDQFVSVIQGEEDRQAVKLDEVSVSLKQALLASEDKGFYQHGGIDPVGILRAFLANLKAGKASQGASTITQQLVKNVFFPTKEWGTLQRKFKEILLAIELEKYYSKDQILEAYLNQVFWGKGSYGIERAAQRYFNKHASELNIAESAYLVGLLPSPSRLHDTTQAIQFQKAVIANMLEYGFISQKQATKALKTPLEFHSAPANLSKHPFYMSVVLDELRKRYGDYELRRMGLKVYTSLDMQAQELAEAKLAKAIKNAPTGINQGAIVTIDVPSNEVRVIVGGVGDFWKHQWNRAVSRHTIGSAFKPFVYLTAFMKGRLVASSTIFDTPFAYDDTGSGKIWNPQNFDKDYWGEMTVRKALVNSRNVPAVRAADKTGVEDIVELAKKLGLVEVEPYLSIALGSSALSPLQVANAYAAIARYGSYGEPIIIRRLVDRKGRTLETNQAKFEQAVPPNPTYELIDVLLDVVDHGTGTRAKLKDRQVAGKTGTADGSRDVWFVGFTTDAVTAIWAGNELNKTASNYATGGTTLAGLWSDYMKSYYEVNPTPVSKFKKPLAYVRKKIDPISGLLATGKSFRPEMRDMVPGTEPTETAPDPSQEDIREYLDEIERERDLLYDLSLDDFDGMEDEEPTELTPEQLAAQAQQNNSPNQNQPSGYPAQGNPALWGDGSQQAQPLPPNPYAAPWGNNPQNPETPAPAVSVPPSDPQENPQEKKKEGRFSRLKRFFSPY